MRFVVAALLVATACTLAAQQPDLPKPESEEPAASPAPSARSSPSPAPESIPQQPLSPEERAALLAQPPPVVPSITELDEPFKDKPISPLAEAAERRAQWRELRNRVANDADLRAVRRKAEAARTDLEKRKLMRAYYELYFGKMIALTPDPGLKSYLNDRKNEHVRALPQPRVRPSPTPAKVTTH
jgi:hypothetical protein